MKLLWLLMMEYWLILDRGWAKVIYYWDYYCCCCWHWDYCLGLCLGAVAKKKVNHEGWRKETVADEK